jgi:hypothetical protein
MGKKFNDLIGTRTHDLLVCSVVPEVNTLLLVPVEAGLEDS